MTGLLALPSGHPIGPYTVEREIGRGATAIALLVRDAHGESFAVKVRRRGVPAADRRFLREFEAMRALRLPGVVRVFEAGLTQELVWFSMEFVDGQPFLDAARTAADPVDRVDRVLDLSCQLLDVLTRLHGSGLAHRDIKPSNVLVDQRGRVQLLDFGIGRYFDHVARSSGESEAFGTMPYMAPEQLAGLRSDERVDIFATGLMIYEALTENRSSPANPLGWVTRTCLDRLPPLAARSPHVPRRLSRVVERLLDVDPRQRLSAREAAERLRKVRTTQDSQDWPEPPFVDPGAWWGELEGALGHPSEPFVWILDGPAGSGRRRAVEQLQRSGLLQGIRTLHLRCDISTLGGPIAETLETVLGSGEDELWIRRIVGSAAGALRQMWPHLPLPPTEGREPVPTLSRVAEAAAEVLSRAATEVDLLLVVHQLEQVDPLSARALHRLAVLSDRALGMVLLHDPRWATDLSEQVMGGLEARQHARILKVPPPSADAARAIRDAITDRAPDPAPDATPQRIVEQAYAALAGWRDETWSPPDAKLWPLAVYEPIPERVLTDLVGDSVLESPWILRTEHGVELGGATARRAARSRLADQAEAAGALAKAWESALGASASPEALAHLYLLAGDLERARKPSARAALRALGEGRYADARRWLFQHDILPSPADEVLPFNVALARAEVALVTEAEEPRELLIQACERAATTDIERGWVAILQAAYALRRGEVRPALVSALRIASPSRAPSPRVAARALMLATRCRLRLGQTTDAHSQLTRAEALIAGGAPTFMEAGLALLRGEVLLATEELDAAGAQAEALLLRARRKNQLHDAASAGLLLCRVLRLVGRRGRAESLARAATADAARTGDLELEAEARLSLATLLVERGDAAGARPHLDDAIRRLRNLHAEHLLPKALRVVLQAAIAEFDPHEADAALAAYRRAPDADPEMASVVVRWWRIRGDAQAALGVPAPPPSSWAYLAWQIERARTNLLIGALHDAVHDAGQARVEALERGFDELELYARLIEHAASDTQEQIWHHTAREAASSLWTDLCFGALELDARRRERAGDTEGARTIWRALRTRCEELGYRPGFEEASAWLSEGT
ncbi:MAG: serine/threonine-protein kinase [Deltaproteobacteria bacterium]|nr:MAG: serine/threonine-protein kinase [Deltaproteobacteria bacterium]